jgi:fatty acid desaturase
MAPRDYSMLGEDGQRAVARGLASARWYQTEIPRTQMKQMMKRSDGPAIRDTALLFAAMVLFAGLGVALWPSWWSAPFWAAYGVLYGSAMDSRWHECGHGTAFKTRRLNNWLYQIASFCMIRNPVTWRYSHARHHTDTIIVGRDPEIAVMRPVRIAKTFANVFGVVDTYDGLSRMVVNALGNLSADEQTWIPEQEQAGVIRVARVWIFIYGATIVVAAGMGSVLPFMVVGLPRLFGAWHHVMTGVLQHGGLADNVLDHRLNSRTVYMNQVSRFIYWNMNYHVEHHMFPMIPYHRLPEMHEAIKHDVPAPSRSIAAAFREMWPALMRQLVDENYFIKRELPSTACPYRHDPNKLDFVAQ